MADDVVRLNPFNLGARVVDDIDVAITRIEESIARIDDIVATRPDGTLDDFGMAATKDARIGAYELNMEAQRRLEPHMQTAADATVFSRLKNADAHLEDANWQLAKKPSPDGRFNGVDLPGALRDSRAAIEILGQLRPIA